MTPYEFRRIRRLTLDLTQEQLASRIGVSRRVIIDIENGETVKTVYELAIRRLADQAMQAAS